MNLSEIKKCDYCNERIPVYWTRCRYCGSLLEVRDESILDENSQTLEGQMTIFSDINDLSKYKTKFHSKDKNKIDGYGRVVDNRALSNGKKVFLTALCTIVPGIGQLIGLILSIIFLSNEKDEDKRSFGKSLLVTSIVVFILSFIWMFLIGLSITFLIRGGI